MRKNTRESTRRKNILLETLKRNGADIADKYIDTVKECTGYDLYFDAVIPDNLKDAIYCIFYLKNETQLSTGLWGDSIAVSTFLYLNDNGIKEGVGKGVKTIVPGKNLGSIVFHLQLLLSIISGIQHLGLSNFTDDPGRATKGIYSLFEIDKRGHSGSDFVGKSVDEQIHLSEGEMRFILRSDSEDIWETKWKELMDKVGRASIKKSKKSKKPKHSKQSKKQKKPKKPKKPKKKNPKNPKKKKQTKKKGK